MEDLFLKLLDMSFSASWVIGAVLLLRLVLKKAPKALRCGLWALVAIRLLCPVSIESAFSLMPEGAPIAEEVLSSPAAYDIPGELSAVVSYPEQQASTTEQPQRGEAYFYADDSVIPAENAEIRWAQICAVVWLAGMGLMLAYALLSYRRVRKKVQASIEIGGSVYLCDYIDSPFILGFLRPRIYLSSSMHPADAEYVLAHERAHLKRRDHWWKPLGFLLLSVYWFNPLIWLAYVLLCRDIELACDERVVRSMDVREKKAYSEALLKCSVPRRMIAACPLAFGEVGVKERVKNVLSYKKPGFWLVLAAGLAIIVAAICLLTDPQTHTLAGLHKAAEEALVCIDFHGEKAELCLDGTEERSDLLELLESVRYDPTPVSLERRESNVDEYGWRYPYIRFTCADSETTLYFTYDYSEVWVKSGNPYRVKDPELLREYVSDYVTPILDRETSAQTFTADTTPYQWMQAVTAEDIATCSWNLCEGQNLLKKTYLSPALLSSLLAHLKAVPQEAITPGQLPEIPEVARNSGIILSSPGLSVLLKLYDGTVALTLGIVASPDQTYLIDDAQLLGFLQDLQEDPPVLSTWLGSRFDFARIPATVSYGNAAISAYRYADWDYEIVEHEKGAASFGIRCRPKDVSEGWFYVSFWPGGYEPKTREGSHSYSNYQDYFQSSHDYPFETETNGSLVVSTRPYAYQVIQYPTGDYVIINEGADGWAEAWSDEHYDEITSLPNFFNFTYGTGDDCQRSYGDVTIDFTAVGEDLRSAFYYYEWEAIADTLHTRSLTLLDVQDYEDNRFVLCQYGAEYAVLVFEADERGVYQFATRRIPAKNLYPDSVDEAEHPSPSGFQFSYMDDDRDLVLCVITDEAISSFVSWTDVVDFIPVAQTPSLYVFDQSATPDQSISFELHDTEHLSFSHNVNYDGTRLQFASETGGSNALWKDDYVRGCLCVFYDRQSHPGNFSLTHEEELRLRDILVGLSPEEIIPGTSPRELRSCIIFSTYDGVQGIGDYWHYKFTYDGEGVSLTLIRYFDSVYENSKEYAFTIQSEALNAFLEALCDPDRTATEIGYNTIPYTAEEEYVEYSHLDANFKIRRLLGWEYEIVAYTDDSTPFGIRCRPEWAEEGWLFVSYWPDGFEPDVEGDVQIINTFGDDTRCYPADIDFDKSAFWQYERNNNWIYHRIGGSSGNYVVLNENAAGWMENGYWSVYDLLYNSTYGSDVPSDSE